MHSWHGASPAICLNFSASSYFYICNEAGRFSVSEIIGMFTMSINDHEISSYWKCNQPFKQSGCGIIIAVDSNQQLLLLFMLIVTWY